MEPKGEKKRGRWRSILALFLATGAGCVVGALVPWDSLAGTEQWKSRLQREREREERVIRFRVDKHYEELWEEEKRRRRLLRENLSQLVHPEPRLFREEVSWRRFWTEGTPSWARAPIGNPELEFMEWFKEWSAPMRQIDRVEGRAVRPESPVAIVESAPINAKIAKSLYAGLEQWLEEKAATYRDPFRKTHFLQKRWLDSEIDVATAAVHDKDGPSKKK